MLDHSLPRSTTTLYLRNVIARNPRIDPRRPALLRDEPRLRIKRSKWLEFHADPARAAANIAQWRTYLAQDCVESMIKSGWHLSC